MKDVVWLAVFSYIYVMVPDHLIMEWLIVAYSATPTARRAIFLCIASFRFDHSAPSGISQCLQFYKSSKNWNMTKSWIRKVHKKKKKCIMQQAVLHMIIFSVFLRCRSVASFWSWVLLLSSLWLMSSLTLGALIWAIICFNYWLISCPTPHQTRLYCAWVIEQHILSQFHFFMASKIISASALACSLMFFVTFLVKASLFMPSLCDDCERSLSRVATARSLKVLIFHVAGSKSRCLLSLPTGLSSPHLTPGNESPY